MFCISCICFTYVVFVLYIQCAARITRHRAASLFRGTWCSGHSANHNACMHCVIQPSIKFFDHFFDRLWTPLGADFLGFWEPKWTQNLSKIDPKKAWITFWAQGSDFSDFWDLTAAKGYLHFGPKMTKNHLKIDPKLNKFFDHFFDRLWSPLGTDLVGFWEPKWIQNWFRIGPKSDHDIKTRVLVLTHKNQLFLHIFCHRGDRKSIKNRSKSHLKAVLSWDAERTRKNHPKWFQKWPNMEPNLAPLEDHLVPKSR